MRLALFAWCFVWAVGVSPLAGRSLDAYRHVDSVDWVVRDLDGVLDGWRRLGFPVEDLGRHTLKSTNAVGESVTIGVRLARGNLNGFQILWIEPLEKGNLYADYLDRRGDGILSLNYRIEDSAAFQREAGRMEGLGAGLLAAPTVPIGGSDRTTVYLKTAPEGRIGFALVRYSATVPPLRCALPVSLEPSQYAFVVRDLTPVSAFWESLGFGAMEVTQGGLSELQYRGRAADFTLKMGWHRFSDITFEWIEPEGGPTVYDEALESHGPGFHHFAFGVDDMDQAILFFNESGFVVSQSGRWGEKGKPGSGRFAYIDTDKLGGVTLELLWNYRE